MSGAVESDADFQPLMVQFPVKTQRFFRPGFGVNGLIETKNMMMITRVEQIPGSWDWISCQGGFITRWAEKFGFSSSARKNDNMGAAMRGLVYLR